jgi:signal transduction histidine kinase
MNPRLRNLRDRIGGRYALSLPIFLFSSPFWIFGFVLNEPTSFNSPDGFIKGLAIATAGQVAMGLTLWLGHLTVGRNRAKSPMSLTALNLVWSASSLARMAVIVAGLNILSLTNDVPLATRLIVSVLMATVGFGLGAYTMDGLARFREQRAELLQNLLESEDQLAAHRTAVSTMKTALVERVDQKMDESRESSERSLDQLERALLDHSDAKPALRELRSLSDDAWRRISADLSVSAPGIVPRIRVLEFLSLFARSGPFRPPLLALLAPFLYVLVYSRVFDPVLGAFVSLAWLGGAVAFGLVANWVLAKLPRFAVPALLASLAMMLFSSLPVLALAEFAGVAAGFPARVISVHAFAIVIILVGSLAPTVNLARQTVLDNLQKYIDQATLEKLHVESQLAIVSQKLASQLHGDVRGNFLAAILNLQHHIDEGQVDDALSVIRKLRLALAERLEAPAEDGNELEALTQFISNWSAILDVSFDTPLESVPEDFMPAVHTVVVDAINNAVRHGDADWVRIGFTIESDALVVNIRNNGTDRANGRAGLGTLHLNQLAPDKWSRFSTEQGIVQLVVRLEQAHISALSGRV